MGDVSEKLREAARAGREFELKALLDIPGCSALDTREDGMTALMWAACGGHESCVEPLLPVSDLLAKDDRGMTALMRAAWNGHEACTVLLLPASNPLASDECGMTALMHAACYKHTGCVAVLLPSSDILAKCQVGLTASDWARQSMHESLAQSIDAYAWAHSEQCAIEAASGHGSHRGRAALRV